MFRRPLEPSAEVSRLYCKLNCHHGEIGWICGKDCSNLSRAVATNGSHAVAFAHRWPSCRKRRGHDTIGKSGFEERECSTVTEAIFHPTLEQSKRALHAWVKRLGEIARVAMTMATS